jgi:hypothetical protein
MDRLTRYHRDFVFFSPLFFPTITFIQGWWFNLWRRIMKSNNRGKSCESCIGKPGVHSIISDVKPRWLLKHMRIPRNRVKFHGLRFSFYMKCTYECTLFVYYVKFTNDEGSVVHTFVLKLHVGSSRTNIVIESLSLLDSN